MIAWLSVPRTLDVVHPRDFDALEEIHAASFPAPWSADEQAALNEAPGVATFVVRRGNAMGTRRSIGFITVRRAGEEAEILTMAVLPRHRRSGVGRMLLEAALRHLYTERAFDVFLEVDPQNAAALALYRHVGFETVGERPHYYTARGDDAPRQHALTMRLRLAPAAAVGRG